MSDPGVEGVRFPGTASHQMHNIKDLFVCFCCFFFLGGGGGGGILVPLGLSTDLSDAGFRT